MTVSGVASHVSVFKGVICVHILSVKPTRKNAQIEPLKMNMVEVPDQDKDCKNKCLIAVGQLGGWDHSTG